MTKKALKGKVRAKRVKAISPAITEENKQETEIIRTAIIEQKPVENMPLTREQIELIKSQYVKGATDDELKLFLAVCSRTGLDPFRKQIYFIKRWDTKQGREVGSAQTSIDGLRSIAERTGKYAGNDDPAFDDEKLPRKAMVTVYKMVEGQRVPFTASARWDQYFPGDKVGFMWKKMPHLMIGKCAEALALRKAFPAAMAGVYIQEEMAQSTPQTKEEVKMLESSKAFEKLKSQIEKMTEKQLDTYEKMLIDSDKYTDEQKQEFCELVETRKTEINEIKEKEKC